MPPLKPEVCIVGNRLAVFMGADYKLLPLDVATDFAQRMETEPAKLRVEVGRRRRIGANGSPSTEHAA